MRSIDRLLTLAAFAVALAACDVTSDEVASISTSPAGRQVQILGDVHNIPNGLGVANIVRAKVMDEEQVYVLPIFSADRMDNSFREQYPTEEWVNENTLRFNSRATDRNRQMSVLNASSVTVRLLRIEAIDLILVVDLQPGSEVQFDMAGGSGAVGVHALKVGGGSVGPTLVRSAGRSPPTNIVIRDDRIDSIEGLPRPAQ